MRPHVEICATALLVCACASEPKAQPAAADERGAINLAYLKCLHTAARKMDDGRSDATSVALGIRTVCIEESARVREVYGRELNPAARRLFDRKQEQRDLEIATSVVLDERAKR